MAAAPGHVPTWLRWLHTPIACPSFVPREGCTAPGSHPRRRGGGRSPAKWTRSSTHNQRNNHVQPLRWHCPLPPPPPHHTQHHTSIYTWCMIDGKRGLGVWRLAVSLPPPPNSPCAHTRTATLVPTGPPPPPPLNPPPLPNHPHTVSGHMGARWRAAAVQEDVLVSWIRVCADSGGGGGDQSTPHPRPTTSPTTIPHLSHCEDHTHCAAPAWSRLDQVNGGSHGAHSSARRSGSRRASSGCSMRGCRQGRVPAAQAPGNHTARTVMTTCHNGGVGGGGKPPLTTTRGPSRAPLPRPGFLKSQTKINS
jgi:hypothetical protein